MEFIKSNYLNTTTLIAVNSNTTTIANLFNPDLQYQYYTDGLNSDLTTSAITITFDVATQISRFALIGINYKEFSVFYNGVTANTFALTSTGSTIASSFLNNTEENIYFQCATTSVNSITLNAKKTITADQEKVIGHLILSDLIYNLDLKPSARNYKPRKVAKQVIHKLSDGGTRIHNIKKKWELNLTFDYLSESQRNSLEDIYNLTTPFIFTAFPTMTSWDAVIFEAVWIGDFDFYEYSDNAISSGYSGKIALKETPS